MLKLFNCFRDIVKLTAQFVARNGRQFLTNLMNREQRNFQFDFLRPQHSLFQYFTKLLEQYTKVRYLRKVCKSGEYSLDSHLLLNCFVTLLSKCPSISGMIT